MNSPELGLCEGGELRLATLLFYFYVTAAIPIFLNRRSG